MSDVVKALLDMENSLNIPAEWSYDSGNVAIYSKDRLSIATPAGHGTEEEGEYAIVAKNGSDATPYGWGQDAIGEYICLLKEFWNESRSKMGCKAEGSK